MNRRVTPSVQIERIYILKGMDKESNKTMRKYDQKQKERPKTLKFLNLPNMSVDLRRPRNIIVRPA